MPTIKNNPPFRGEHVGSLLRPPELRAAFGDFQAGRLDAEGFQLIQDQAVREVVRMQENVGLEAVTDGEFRRTSYWSHFVEKVDGLTVKPAIYRFHDEGGETEFLAPHVEGKVRRIADISALEFEFLESATLSTAKITMPSPPTLHFWRGRAGVDPAAYNNEAAFFADLAVVYKEEINDLAGRGLTYLQIDDVPLAMLCDPMVREGVAADGDDPDRLIGAYIDLINASLADVPPDVTLAMHMCRGNFKSRWLSEGGYDAVAERVLNEVKVHVFFLEYDTPRAGDFAPLRFLPSDKSVVLGLISTKTPELEDGDGLRRRIDQAAEIVPLEQLGLSPQCGFSSTVGGNPLTQDDQRAKLDLVVSTAIDVWG